MAEDHYQYVEKQRIEFIHHQENLLFQRFNYFLIGMAFLITAFATLIVNENSQNTNPATIQTLLYTIFSISYILSVFFTLANYLASQTIQAYWKSLYSFDFNKQFKDYISDIWENDEKNKKLRNELIEYFFSDSFYSLVNPFRKEGRHSAQHTWLIPFGFMLAWIFTLAFVIIGGWSLLYIYLLILLLIVLPFLTYYFFLGIFKLTDYCKQKRKERRVKNLDEQVDSLFYEAEKLHQDAYEKWRDALSGRKLEDNMSQEYQISISRILIETASKIEDFSKKIKGTSDDKHKNEIKKYLKIIDKVKKYFNTPH